ncbi:MAG: ribonuclease PH [Myxococcales bacterium]|nr:ribonuclease PH [Myxococcales bacterium]
MTRPDGRKPDELRPTSIELGFQKYAEGSALIKSASTWVLCAASVEQGVPSFLRDAEQGWVTAEYAMLPRATHFRSRRKASGRDKEIQRLIGRSLRASVDMKALGEHTMTIDCDVLQADGGTRTAAITGAWVAMALAVKQLKAEGKIAADAAVLSEPVAAISVGIIDGEARLDLPYEEDSNAGVDMNVVMTESGRLIEIQGTAEKATFDRKELNTMLDLAHKGIIELCATQRACLG